MSKPPADTTLHRARLADQVAEALLDRIRDNRLPPGTRMPTERELGEEFGVSRTVVREATRFLLARGVVEVAAGRGLVVAAVDPDAASEALGLLLHDRVREDYAAVHEIRELLEVGAARRAAERADDGDLAALRRAHERMLVLADGGDLEQLSRADIEFHRRLAATTGNDLFLVLLDAVTPALLSVRRTNLALDEGRDEAVEAHTAILEAVAGRDADAAAAAMRAHLDYVVARWAATTGQRGAEG